MELEPMYLTLVALTVQYLNVRQRKFDTIITKIVHILQHDTLVVQREICMDNKFLLPNNPARQEYRYISVSVKGEIVHGEIQGCKTGILYSPYLSCILFRPCA
jgi:hypothetical protein